MTSARETFVVANARRIPAFANYDRCMRTVDSASASSSSLSQPGAPDPATQAARAKAAAAEEGRAMLLCIVQPRPAVDVSEQALEVMQQAEKRLRLDAVRYAGQIAQLDILGQSASAHADDLDATRQVAAEANAAAGYARQVAAGMQWRVAIPGQDQALLGVRAIVAHQLTALDELQAAANLDVADRQIDSESANAMFEEHLDGCLDECDQVEDRRLDANDATRSVRGLVTTTEAGFLVRVAPSCLSERTQTLSLVRLDQAIREQCDGWAPGWVERRETCPQFVAALVVSTGQVVRNVLTCGEPAAALAGQRHLEGVEFFRGDPDDPFEAASAREPDAASATARATGDRTS